MDIVAATLFALLILILVLPLFVKKIEENLELFLFSMGIVAGLVTGKIWDAEIWQEALREPLMIHDLPIGIFQVVLIFGLLAYFLRRRIETLVTTLMHRLGPALMLGILTFVLGLASSLISVIVASVILSEIVLATRLDRMTRTLYSIYSCYALGIGAILTPVGEPLATIVASQLREAEYYTGPFFLFEMFAAYVIPLVAFFSYLAATCVKRGQLETTPSMRAAVRSETTETIQGIIMRALRVYVFIVALVILGKSFSVLVEKYFSKLTSDLYYAIGIISAVVDNATLAAAMIGPELTREAVLYFILSALISGGFLIPGNIPNIIVASRLGIGFREWAIHAIKIGMPIYILTYVVLKLVHLVQLVR